VIRSWLGHVSLDTTNHHAQANPETKRKALERVGRAARAGKLPDGNATAASLRGSTRYSLKQKYVKERKLNRWKTAVKASLLRITTSC
jgi:hypothetical protein